MRTVVFDIETQNTFADVGGYEPALLDISLVGIYESETDSYQSFLYDELEKLWPILEKTELIVGYNSDHFDIPLLDKYYMGDLTNIRSLDLLSEIKNASGKRLKLDQIAEATLGEKKSGHGLQAVTWWRQGKIDEIRKYCLDDVRITKEIYDYAKRHGEVKYILAGEVLTIKLDTSHWDTPSQNAMTQSLL